MDRRSFIVRFLIGFISLVLGGLGLRWRKGNHVNSDGAFDLNYKSPHDRVMFVCCDKYKEYSVGTYLHGPAGGGPACLKFAKTAAPSMRSVEPSDSAAGLCGRLFKIFGDEVAADGGLSIVDSPRPRPDGSVDWQAYCGWNVDLVLIDIDRKTAECYVSKSTSEADPKTLVARLTGLGIK